VQEISVGMVQPNPRSKRGPVRGPDAPREEVERTKRLAASIRRYGLLHPIGVITVPGGFEVVYGDRRLAAHVEAGQERIRATVWSIPEEARRRALTVTENIQHQALRPKQRSLELWGLLEELFGTPLGGAVSDEHAATAAEWVGIGARALRRQLQLTRPEPSRRGRRPSVLDAREFRAALQRAVEPTRVAGLSTVHRERLKKELVAVGRVVDRALSGLATMSEGRTLQRVDASEGVK
jgi:ParB-like chromosome segregation protein Spo0J